MGKKVEKALKEKASAVSSEDEAKNAEDYQCTGNLDQDFTELCNRVGLTEIPKVTARAHLPATPAFEKITHEETDVTSEKDMQASATLIRDTFTYFKPCIQVELESEDAKSVREIFIRGWKIDEKMMGIFNKCLPALTNLQGMNLWNAGLTDDTLDLFVTILPRCLHLKTIVLDGNPLPQQSYHKLIGNDTTVANLVLRNNKIDDSGARLIGQALRGVQMGNKNLISLNLSYNRISDEGAGFIAEGLRLNRSLLWLDLSNNQIGDQGALKLAEVLGHFALTHTEVVERRLLLQTKEVPEHSRSPVLSRHTDVKMDRPQSHQSATVVEKADKTQGTKAGKSASKKKEKEKDPPKKDEKTGANQTGGGTGQAKKEDPKLAKKQVANAEQKNIRGKGTKSAVKEKRAQFTELESAEVTEISNPLLEPAEHRDGKVFLSGNKLLINLNLIRNRITEQGLKGFLTALETQIRETSPIPGTKSHTGLLRLSIAKNNFPAENETFLRIQELMMSRDPLHRTIFKSTEEEPPAAS